MPSVIPIEAPLATPPKFGLLASITPEKIVDNRIFAPDAILSYAPEGCQTGETFDPCGSIEFTPSTRPDNVEWHTYGLSVREACSTPSGGYEERQARIVRLLNLDTERQLGAELWDGAIAQASTLPVSGDPWPNTWLANAADIDYLSESGPVGLVHALACLEQYLASNNGGQQGAIHATAQIVTHWESFRLLRREGNRILTFKDTVVIASPGYSGNSPNGAVGDNDIWAYATDLPRIFLGPIQTFDLEDSVDRENNDVEMSANRPALVEWQRCRHAGIRIAADACDQGGS